MTATELNKYNRAQQINTHTYKELFIYLFIHELNIYSYLFLRGVFRREQEFITCTTVSIMVGRNLEVHGTIVRLKRKPADLRHYLLLSMHLVHVVLDHKRSTANGWGDGLENVCPNSKILFVLKETLKSPPPSIPP